jgi:hypothetical protein
MRSALLFSTVLGFVALPAFPPERAVPDQLPVIRTKAERVVASGLIRGVMTSDLKTLTYVGANSCLLWGAPTEPDGWEQLGRAKQFVLLNSLGPVKQGFFDLEAGKPVRMTTPYCWSNEFGAWWIEHMAQGAAKKYPAVVCVTPDEVAWNNGIVPYLFNVPQPVGTKFYCDCQRCAAGAGGLPAITASRFLDDTEASRRFIRYRYRAFADAMKTSLDAARKADPSFLSYYCLNLKEVMSLERYPSGIALDMLPETDILMATGFQTSCDRRGEETRFIPALTTKHLLAARPRIGALPCLAATVYDYRRKFDWTEAYYWREEIEELLPAPVLDAIRQDLAPYKLTDDEIILPALSAIAHGAKGVMFFGDEQRDALKRLFLLMERLQEPLTGATVPNEVVVLCSRTSEDDWMLEHAPKAGSRADLTDAMVQSGCWAQPAGRIAWEFSKNGDHSQGLRSTQAVMQALVRLGIPFRMHFAENLRPEDVNRAKVVVVPFCTHISSRSAAVLSEPPLERKVIVFAHSGQMDEDGNRRAKPAIDGMPARFVSFDGEASDVLRDAAGRKKLADAVGGVFDVQAQCASEDVERVWLRLADGGVAVFLINWSDKVRTVQVRLPGTAKATRLGTSGTSSEINVSSTTEVAPRDAQVIIQRRARP